MDVSNYFEFIVKHDAFPEDVTKIGLKPAGSEAGGFKYPLWKKIGADFLVLAGYRVSGGELTIDTYTYAIDQQKLVLGKSYTAKLQDVRVLAHTFANDLIKALTGQKGMFLSKLVVSRTTQ